MMHISVARKKQREEFKTKWKSYKNYLRSEEWKARKEEFKQDWDHKCEFNFIGCIGCEKDKNIEVHHKHYKSLGFEKRRDVNIICHFCHHEHHKGTAIFPYDLEKEEYNEEKERSWQIFNALRVWRLKKTRDNGWPNAYCVFKDRTLKELSEKKPRPITIFQFGSVWGVGHETQKYGPEIVKIINDIVSQSDF